MNRNKLPIVGIGTIIIKDGKVLLGRRVTEHGKETWSVPGGHLEFKEEIEEGCIREVKEETNINIKNLKFVTVTNNIFPDENMHSITIFMRADYDSGEIKVNEPENFRDVGWFDWDNLPQPLFLPMKILVESGYTPFKEPRVSK